jgi:hypothetical protein
MMDIDPENIECPNCGTLGGPREGGVHVQVLLHVFQEGGRATRGTPQEAYRGGLQGPRLFTREGFPCLCGGRAGNPDEFGERKALAERLKEEGFAIDPWVTEGEARLARLPVTLNGMVSRICMPIEVEEIESWTSGG